MLRSCIISTRSTVAGIFRRLWTRADNLIFISEYNKLTFHISHTCRRPAPTPYSSRPISSPSQNGQISSVRWRWLPSNVDSLFGLFTSDNFLADYFFNFIYLLINNALEVNFQTSSRRTRVKVFTLYCKYATWYDVLITKFISYDVIILVTHCQCILTVHHILVECNHFARKRKDIFGRRDMVESFRFHPTLTVLFLKRFEFYYKF